jgi:lipid-binding SYLF domain-containing protein
MGRPVNEKALSVELERIEALDRTSLIDLWQGFHDLSAPKSLSLTFLRRAVAYEIQCRALGGMNGKTKSKLRRLAKTVNTEEHAAILDVTAPQKLVPGARLIRDWNGKTWVVDVTDAGFVLQGETYRSLTAIAKRITGAHWSGPRFFGLKSAPSGGRTPAENERAV